MSWLTRARQHEKYLPALRACRFEINLPPSESNKFPLFVHCIYFHFLHAHRACQFEIYMPASKTYMPWTFGKPSFRTLQSNIAIRCLEFGVQHFSFSLPSQDVVERLLHLRFLISFHKARLTSQSVVSLIFDAVVTDSRANPNNEYGRDRELSLPQDQLGKLPEHTLLSPKYLFFSVFIQILYFSRQISYISHQILFFNHQYYENRSFAFFFNAKICFPCFLSQH